MNVDVTQRSVSALSGEDNQSGSWAVYLIGEAVEKRTDWALEDEIRWQIPYSLWQVTYNDRGTLLEVAEAKIEDTFRGLGGPPYTVRMNYDRYDIYVGDYTPIKGRKVHVATVRRVNADEPPETVYEYVYVPK